MPRKPPSAAKLPKPAQRGAAEAQALLAKVMLRVANKHGDDAMRAAGERGEGGEGQRSRVRHI